MFLGQQKSGAIHRAFTTQFLGGSIFKRVSEWGLRDPPDFAVSVYHTQTQRVKGQNILKRYWAGPSGQTKFLKLPPHTMATTGQQ